MTVNRSFLPELSCPNCDFVGDSYLLEYKGVHTKVTCPNCNQFIKFLSKEDKYGTREQQQEIWEKTNGRCCYCGTPLNPFKRRSYTYEHVDPQYNGGGNETENLMPCCQSCNSQKGKKTLSEYRKWLKGRNGQPFNIFYFEVCQFGPTPLREVLRKLF